MTTDKIKSVNISPFMDLIAMQLTPVVQIDFVHGINIQLGTSTVANSATVDTNESRLRLQSGTNSAGSAIFNTKRSAKYRAGQGMIARFTPLFTVGVANSKQIWGIGNVNDGYFIGYNGADFGILHRNATVDTWISQADWNGDEASNGVAFDKIFPWDTTKGYPFQVIYPYLGYGDVHFERQDPSTGVWVRLHTIRYAGSSASVQASNPNLSFYGQCLNSGNTTNLTMMCGSVGLFICGPRNFVGSPKWSTDSSKSSITTETNLLTVKNATTYNTIANRGLIRLVSVTVSSSAASGIAIARLKIGATLGGSPSYAAINGTTGDNGVTITSGNSIASADVAGTTVANGLMVISIVMDNPGNSIIDLIPYEIFIATGETITVSGYSSANATMAASLNWAEDI
jgi:hypothetical protein